MPRNRTASSVREKEWRLAASDRSRRFVSSTPSSRARTNAGPATTSCCGRSRTTRRCGGWTRRRTRTDTGHTSSATRYSSHAVGSRRLSIGRRDVTVAPHPIIPHADRARPGVPLEVGIRFHARHPASRRTDRTGGTDMRIRDWVGVAMMCVLLPAAAMAQGQAAGGAPQRAGGAPPPAMALTTTAFPDGDPIPAKYTQAGEQVSPALTWSNVPPNTVSFVLHMHDPDVARNKTTEDQVHWLVWNIPGTATGFREGMPKGAQLPDGSFQISASGAEYRGPGAPASGPMHHYTFELYALDTKLDVQPGTDAWDSRTSVMKAMQGHILGKAVYVGLFRRPQ